MEGSGVKLERRNAQRHNRSNKDEGGTGRNYWTLWQMCEAMAGALERCSGLIPWPFGYWGVLLGPLEGVD